MKSHLNESHEPSAKINCLLLKFPEIPHINLNAQRANNSYLNEAQIHPHLSIYSIESR